MPDRTVHRQELTPLHFLERAGEVYAERPAVVDGDLRLTWREMRARARRLASALIRVGRAQGRPRRLPRPQLRAAAGRALRGPRWRAACWSPSIPGSTPTRSPTSSSTRARGPSSTLRSCTPQLARDPATGRRATTSRRTARPSSPTGSEARIAPPVADEDETITINYTSRHHRPPEGRHVHPPRRLAERARRGVEHGSPRDASTSGRCRCSTATAGASPGR